MSEPDLLTDAGQEPDPVMLAIAEAHREKPGAKLVHVTDTRHGAAFVLAIPPESPWHELLPD